MLATLNVFAKKQDQKYAPPLFKAVFDAFLNGGKILIEIPTGTVSIQTGDPCHFGSSQKLFFAMLFTSSYENCLYL